MNWCFMIGQRRNGKMENGSDWLEDDQWENFQGEVDRIGWNLTNGRRGQIDFAIFGKA